MSTELQLERGEVSLGLPASLSCGGAPQALAGRWPPPSSHRSVFRGN